MTTLGIYKGVGCRITLTSIEWLQVWPPGEISNKPAQQLHQKHTDCYRAELNCGHFRKLSFGKPSFAVYQRWCLYSLFSTSIAVNFGFVRTSDGQLLFPRKIAWSQLILLKNEVHSSAKRSNRPHRLHLSGPAVWPISKVRFKCFSKTFNVIDRA